MMGFKRGPTPTARPTATVRSQGQGSFSLPKTEETQRGRSRMTSVLQEGRPNSRDKQPRRQRKDDDKGEQLSSPSLKRQLSDDIPSPGSKENVGVPPARKKLKTPEPQQRQASSLASPPPTEKLPTARNRAARKAAAPRVTPSSSSDSDSELAPEERRDTEEVLNPSAALLQERIKLRKQIQKSIKRQREAEKEAPPRPHQALLYYQQRLEGTSGVESCSGIIKKVKLWNFMCHEGFEKEWNSNLNFITGENGSGKSAILSGIIIGLGARANTTSRTKSVTGLVKTGKDFAKTEITLLNNGVLREDKYGKDVTIQRVIDARGTSTYKLNDGLNSKYRALRRTELDFILFNLGIMVDNPVAVLNQEAARSFLKTSDPKDKYKFFFEGSSLAQLDRILAETQRNMEDVKANLERSEQIVEDRHEDVNKYKALKLKLDEAEQMEEIITKLTIEYYWSLVIAEEAKRDHLMEELKQMNTRKDRCNDVHEALLRMKTELLASVQSNPEEIDNLKTKLRDGGKLDQDVQRELTQLNRQIVEQKTKARVAQGQVTAYMHTIQKLEAKIEELSTTGEEEAENARREYEEKTTALEDKKVKYERELQTLKTEKQQFLHGTESLRTQLEELRVRERELKNRIVRLKEEMKNLQNKNSNVNKYSVFGRSMEELMAKIQANQHKFKVPPRGPLGSCFTIKNEKWVRLIESILNNQLFDFVVENTADQNLLNQFIKQTFNRPRQSGTDERIARRPAVICNKAAFNKTFDISRMKATTPDHPTILDLIEVENNDMAVLNTLIDSCTIERILLFDTNKDACELLKDRRNPEFPKNAVVGFSLEFYQITPDPRYRLEAKNQRHPNTYLKCSSAAQLRHLQKGISEAENGLEELVPELERKKKEEQVVRSEFNSQEELLRSVQQKLNEVKTQLLTLSKITLKAPDVASFVEELTETKGQLDEAQGQQELAVQACRAVQPKIEELKQKKVKILEENELLDKRIQELVDIHENFQGRIEKIETNMRAAKLKLRDAQGRCDALQPQLDRLEVGIEEKVTEAEEKGERVDTARNPTSIQDEVRNYGDRVKEAKKLTGDRQEILNSLAKARDVYQQLRAEHLCWFEIARLLENYVDMNVKYYKMIIQVIGNVLISSFQSLISSRGYTGRLLIEHEKQELYYFVCPDGKANQKTMEALKSNNNKVIKHALTEYANGLSGGERSFATICYIISMWQIMECPFFMLDEFDVFMDPFNRKASQNALISHANRFKSHQFFLYTPLDITELKDTRNAIILKMFPPNRNDVVADDNGVEDTGDGDGEDRAGGKRRKRGAPNQPGTSRQGTNRRGVRRAED